jgi:hypothetical protein
LSFPLAKKGGKATLHKVFILDAQGGYKGEIPLDENCVVEYSDFLAAVPETGVEDGKSIFLGEWKATAIYGERMGLVAISKGLLGPEELNWARTALVAAEATLIGEESPPPEVEAAAAVDTGVMESLARALDGREAQLKQREAVLKEMEERTRAAVEEYRQETETQLADLKARLAAAQEQHEKDLHALAAERDRLRGELETIAKAPRPTAESAARDPTVVAARVQLEKNRELLQERAAELLTREDAVREREAKVEEESQRLQQVREEIDAKRAQVEEAKNAPPPFDYEAAKREIEARVKILQQKAFDLLAREEKLRKRAQEIKALLSASE